MEQSTNSKSNRWLDGLKLRQTTKNLVNNLLFDLPLTPSQCQDFGVDSANHYRALRDAIFNDPEEAETLSDEACLKQTMDRVKALDQALGNGPKITAFVQKHAPAYKLTFRTPFDFLEPLESDE